MKPVLPIPSSLDDLAEALPQILWGARPDGTVDWINREFERYTGIAGADYAAGEWLLAVHPDDHAATLDTWDRSRARGVAYRTHFRVWCAASGEWRWHLVDARTHRNRDGQITRWYGHATDIQDIRDAQAARDSELRLQRIERGALEALSKDAPKASILKDICTAMGEVMPGAIATVAMINDAGTHLDSCHGVKMLEGWSRAVGPIPVGEGLGACGTAIFRREPVYSVDIANDPHWYAYRALAAEHGLAACWSHPIMAVTGEPIASLAYYFSTPRVPDAAQKAMLHRMSELVGNVISQAQSRDRLRASEHRYRSLFDFLPIAIWEEDISDVLTMLDALRQEGVRDLAGWLNDHPEFIDHALSSIRVLDANETARALYGISGKTSEAYERSFSDLAAQPRFREAVRTMLEAAWSGGDDLSITYPVRLPDGSTAEILSHMLLPEADSGRLLVTELDVTEQRRAEERFRHVAFASSDFIFERDLATETLWVSDGAVWNSDLPSGPCTVSRAVWVSRIHPEDTDIPPAIDKAIQSGAEFWEGEYRLKMGSGDYAPVRQRSSILRDDCGAPVRLIGNLVDLSEQKALEAQLHQAQRLEAVGQLTGGIAHDFNNLLTVILGNAEMLVDALSADGRLGKFADQIVSASERASELTQHLLAFARKQPLAPGVHDPCEIIEGMRTLIERSLTPAIALELDLAGDTGSVHVDRAMFESALLNLCLNARDAMSEGGTLRITVAPAPDDLVRINVADTGAGMDDATRNRVFEPFFTTKPTGEGTGLGLSMVYGFVQQSGGQVQVESAPDDGTTVALLLPVHHGASDAEVPTQARPDADSAPFAGRILVVEDHEQVRDYTCMLVHSLGFEAISEPCADDALARLRAGESFDLLLSDVVMPGGMSGRKLAETVRRHWPELPVLLVSGHADEVVNLQDHLGRGIGFLRKPFRKRDLAAALTGILQGIA